MVQQTYPEYVVLNCEPVLLPATGVCLQMQGDGDETVARTAFLQRAFLLTADLHLVAKMRNVVVKSSASRRLLVESIMESLFPELDGEGRAERVTNFLKQAATEEETMVKNDEEGIADLVNEISLQDLDNAAEVKSIRAALDAKNQSIIETLRRQLAEAERKKEKRKTPKAKKKPAEKPAKKPAPQVAPPLDAPPPVAPLPDAEPPAVEPPPDAPPDAHRLRPGRHDNWHGFQCLLVRSKGVTVGWQITCHRHSNLQARCSRKRGFKGGEEDSARCLRILKTWAVANLQDGTKEEHMRMPRDGEVISDEELEMRGAAFEQQDAGEVAAGSAPEPLADAPAGGAEALTEAAGPESDTGSSGSSSGSESDSSDSDSSG